MAETKKGRRPRRRFDDEFKAQVVRLVLDEGKTVAAAAWLAPGPVLDVDGRRIEARHYLVATGSSRWVPPIEGVGDVE